MKSINDLSKSTNVLRMRNAVLVSRSTGWMCTGNVGSSLARLWNKTNLFREEYE